MDNSRGRIIATMTAAQLGSGVGRRVGRLARAALPALLLLGALSAAVAAEENSNTGDQTASLGNQTTAELGNPNRSQKAEQLERQLLELRYRFETNRAIDERPYYCLLAVYLLLMLVGTIFNSLILFTVVLRPSILSPRNIFVVNLAASDLLLCVFTMPFSFIEISMKMWQLGLLPCKLVAGLQATSIFVSTISILAIALDRYRVIVYPTQQQEQGPSTRRRDMLILASVWALALSLSLPLFCFRTVRHMELPHKYETSIKGVDFCIEEWPVDHGRGIYSVISMIFQYVLPISIVSIVYAKISKRLQKRLIRRQQQLTQSECKQKRQLNLIKRTHTMLVSVSLVFGFSWLPLNLLNVIGDFTDLFTGDTGDEQQFRVVFAVCHLIGCLSACTNPVLYGYMNDNFRKEALVAYGNQLNRLGRLVNLKTGTASPRPPANQHYRRSQEANVCGFGLTSKRPRAGQPEPSVVSLGPRGDQTSPGSNRLQPHSFQPLKGPPNNSMLARLPSSSPSASSASPSTSTSNTSTSSTGTGTSTTTTSSTCSTSGGSHQELVAGAAAATCDERDNQLGSPSQQQWLTLATNLRPGGSHVVLNMDRLLAAGGGGLKASANGLDAAGHEQRRCSFQASAASSGAGGQHHHHHLGTTMRLCLCISRTSSESQVVHAGESQQARARPTKEPGAGQTSPCPNRCPCQCHHGGKLGALTTTTTTPTMRLRSASQTSSLVAATASALASSAAAATAKVGELRRRAHKLLSPLGPSSASPAAPKHSTDADQPEPSTSVKRPRCRRRRDKRPHRHQSHCSACRDNHHRRRRRRSPRCEDQRGAGVEPPGTSDLAAVETLTPTPSTKEGRRSASMAVLGATGEAGLEAESATMPMTASATSPRATNGGSVARSGSEQRPTNNKAPPGETMSSRGEQGVAGAMRRQPASFNLVGTNSDAINADNLDCEDCDCSHSSSLLTSCHLYSHSSSCTCSCRSSFSCPFMQHLGRPLPHGAPTLPLVAPGAAATAAAAAAAAATTSAPGQLRRLMSGQAAHRGADGDEPSFMHRDTCGCPASPRLHQNQHQASFCSCSPTANSPTTSCADGSCSQQQPSGPMLSDEASSVVQSKGSVDETSTTNSNSIRQSATTKIACNGPAACPSLQDAGTTSREAKLN